MTYKKKATFAVIGKPNNGKSSIISALTFDDTIEIYDEIGTTTKSSKYIYTFNGEEVCSFYDTPGFEYAEYIYSYIENQKKYSLSINQIFENFIKEYSNNKSMQKDIEIIKAIIDSDFLVFVINISDKFNINVIGYELEILKELKKRVVILFNQVDKNKDFSSKWEEELKKYGLSNIYKINPLNSSYSNIIRMLKLLYSANLDIAMYDKQQLDNVINTYKKDFNIRLEKSAKLISKYLKDVLQTEIKITRGDAESGKGYELISKEIDKKEKEIQKRLSKLWGYFQVKVEDKREKYYAEINQEIALSKNEKAVASAAIGAVTFGSITTLLSGGLDFGGGAVVGGTIGYIMGYFSDGFYKVELFKKDATITISSKDINLSVILITRILEFVKAIIHHGHANRNSVIISKIEKRNFSNEEIKLMANIHTSFVKDKNAEKSLEELKIFVFKILTKEIKQ